MLFSPSTEMEIERNFLARWNNCDNSIIIHKKRIAYVQGKILASSNTLKNDKIELMPNQQMIVFR